MSITSESWWGREIVPAAIDATFRRCCDFFHSDPLGGGTKGNAAHTKGRHRSLEWCLNSAFCTDRSYGTRDKRDRDGNPRHIRAFDLKLTRAQIREVSHRLDDAVRAGQLPQVAEWFGTFDNQQVVGWYEGHPSSADDSHLAHVHVGVWTIYADDQAALDEIYEVMTGETMALTPEDIDKVAARTVQMLLQKDLTIPEDWKTQFPDDPTIQDGTIGYDTCVRSGYFHSRQANEDADVLLTELEEIKAMLAAMPGGTPLPPAGATVSLTGTLELTPVEPTEPSV